MNNYRLWDTKRKEMLKVVAIDFESTFSFIEAIDSRDNVRYFPRNSEILMSTTGAKDNRGDDIFIGDIISNYKEVLHVAWSEDKLAYVTRGMNSDKNEKLLYETLFFSDYMIIGDIHRNKEFLRIGVVH